MVEEQTTPGVATETSAPKSPKANPALFVGVAIIVAIAAFFLVRGSAQENDSEMEGMDMEGEMMDEAGTGSASGTVEAGSPEAEMVDASDNPIKTVTVEGGSFYYKPNEIRVKQGEKVKIVLNSVDMVHDFVIDELGVRTAVIKGGDTTTVEFTADKVGTFEYYCSVGQHRKNGMAGKLIVE